MQSHRQLFDITVMCEVLRVSRSGFYGWLERPPSKRSEWRAVLCREVEIIFHDSRKTYGSPRVHNELLRRGLKVSEPTVARIMQELGLASKVAKKRRVTTRSEKSHLKAPNHLLQDFTTQAPNQVWLGDITYIATGEGWLYLALIIDLCTRKAIGWSMMERMTTALTLSALEMAIGREQPGDGVLFHSDQGCQYTADEMTEKLKANGFIASMSRRGNCYDNAPMESFFHTLKTELVYHEVYETRDQARRSIFEWIEAFYNRQRIHSSLGYKTPLEKEQEYVLDAA